MMSSVLHGCVEDAERQGGYLIVSGKVTDG